MASGAHPLSLTKREAVLLVKLGAPIILLHLIDYICQSIPVSSVNACRNLQVFEVFSGVSRIHAQARKFKLKSDYFDWLHRPRINNIETVQGLIYAVRQTLRLVSGGLCFLGIPCSLLVWISISTSKRGIQGWDLYGDNTLDCVVRSNLHLSRAALLIMICVARSVYWAAEQPGSSKLPQLDYFSTLLSDFRIPTYMTRFWMGCFSHICPKPSMLLGSWPAIPLFKNKMTKKRREQLKALQKKKKKVIVQKSPNGTVSGGKDLKDTGAYPLPFAKRVIQEQRRLIASKEEPTRLELDDVKEEPCLWVHADLAEIKAFLRDRIEEGTFQPLFEWDDDDGFDERLNNVC